MPPAVLITGGARRIGAAIARPCCQVGWHVIIHHRDSHDEAEALAAALPSAEAVACDLADGDASVALIEALATRLPDWRVLVNNASVFHHDDTARLDPAVLAEAMAVNAATPMRMAQAYLARATAKGGRRVIRHCGRSTRMMLRTLYSCPPRWDEPLSLITCPSTVTRSPSR